MTKPSFINILTQAHHFTLRNLGVFLPLVVKTFLFVALLVLVFAASMIELAVLAGIFHLNHTLKSFGQVFATMNPALLISGSALIILFFLGLILASCPFAVSLYRRALLDEEIDPRYLARLFARREVNFFIALLKVQGVFFVIIFLAVILIAAGFVLAAYLHSTLFNFIAGVTGIAAFLWFIGFLFFLSARLEFVRTNVVLDLGSNLRTSILQSRGYTFFLIGITLLASIIAQVIQRAVFELINLITMSLTPVHTARIITSIVAFIIALMISYYITIFVPAAIAYTYKAVVLKEGATDEADA